MEYKTTTTQQRSEGANLVGKNAMQLKDNRGINNLTIHETKNNVVQKVGLQDQIPARQIEGDEAIQSANRLREISASWRGLEGEDPEYNMADNEWYSQRMVGVADIAQDIAGNAEDDAFRHYVYEVDGEPVAMQSLRDSPLQNYNNYTWIESLVTHPGTSDGGATMIEHTVNISQADGNNGRVVLAAYGESATFYERLGFQITDDVYEENIDGNITSYPVFTLDPNENPQWNFDGENWRLNFFNDRMQYLS